MLKTPNGRRFGGYADLAWSSTIGTKPSTRAFLFRLGGAVGPSDGWQRARAGVKPELSDEALYHDARYGPIWEGKLVIHIHGNRHFASGNHRYQPFPENENVAGGAYGDHTELDLQEWEVF